MLYDMAGVILAVICLTSDLNLICMLTKYEFMPFYCSDVEHQKADWMGIHEKICQSLIPLRQAAPFLPSEEDRQKREKHLQIKKVLKNPFSLVLFFQFLILYLYYDLFEN